MKADIESQPILTCAQENGASSCDAASKKQIKHYLRLQHPRWLDALV
jgi:hypothetical protein